MGKAVIIGVINVLSIVTAVGAGPLHDCIMAGDLAGAKALAGQDRTLLETKDANGLTALNLAACHGKADIVAYLISAGADIEAGDNENSRPLHNAAVSGNVEILKLLLAHGADIDQQDNNGVTPLHFALSYNRPEAARYLMDNGADISIKNRQGWSTLLYAAVSGNTDLVKLLIDRGVKVRNRKFTGISPLHSAASYGRLDMAKLLIGNGADVNAQTEDGTTPLFWASNANCLEVARCLIQNGADVNHRNADGGTPLHNIAHRGSVEIIKLLLDNGADINAVTRFGWTPLGQSVFGGLPAVEYLILHGAQVNPASCGHNGESGCSRCVSSPLHAAAMHGDIEILKVLLNNGARINILDENGCTPLHIAVQRKHTEIVRCLLEKGAFIGIAESHFGRTELHTAAINGDRDITDSLISAGCELNTTDRWGRTPVEDAFYHGHDRIAYALLAAGAEDGDIVRHVTRQDMLATDLPSGSAVIWFLGHSGWAVKTRNHLLVFDDFINPQNPAPDTASLANGFIVPSELKDQSVTVFVSHGHADHYHPDIFKWKQDIPEISYVLGFAPPHIDPGEYTFIPPHQEMQVSDMTITAIKSTDTGAGFLVEVDGLVIFHAGDHASGRDELVEPYREEIDYLAETTNAVDIAFFPVTGCGLGDPVKVRDGVRYAAKALKSKVIIPMHAGTQPFRFIEFAEALSNDNIPVNYVTDPGDRIEYRDGRML